MPSAPLASGLLAALALLPLALPSGLPAPAAPLARSGPAGRGDAGAPRGGAGFVSAPACPGLPVAGAAACPQRAGAGGGRRVGAGSGARAGRGRGGAWGRSAGLRGSARGGGEEGGRRGGAPRELSDEEREAANRWITPEVKAQFTLPDGSVDYKAMSKLVPLQADYGPLDVVYEDEGLLAVSKPSGMVMNPPHRFSTGTLVNRVIGYTGNPPYVLHRLDMWTSGLVLFSKAKEIVPEVNRQFREREVGKVYLCVVDGAPAEEAFTVDAAIGRDADRALLRVIGGEEAKESLTFFEVVSVSPDRRHSLLKVFPRTGRTHQIRVHAQYAGFPIMGDNVYGAEASLYGGDKDLMDAGSKKELRSLADTQESRRRVPLKLHALSLTLTHPATGKELTVSAPLPEHFDLAMKEFGLAL